MLTSRIKVAYCAELDLLFYSSESLSLVSLIAVSL